MPRTRPASRSWSPTTSATTRPTCASATRSPALPDARFLRVTTLESPIQPYVAHYPLAPGRPADDAVARAPPGGDRGEHHGRDRRRRRPVLRRIYHSVLLDTLVHELNAVRGLLGEPDRLDYVDLRETSLTVMLRFGSLPVAIHWIDLPGIARYKMEFALYAPDRRVTLSFPSPFLRSEPTVLEIEAGESGSARSTRLAGDHVVRERFKRELHRVPRRRRQRHADRSRPGRDAMRDIALCQAIIECARTGRPIDQPTRLPDEPRAGIVVANAPVSYGAFELTVGIDPNVPDGVEVLDEVAAAGYAGIDLGPVGYPRRGARAAASGWQRATSAWPARTSSCRTPTRRPLTPTLPALDDMLDTFDAAAPYSGRAGAAAYPRRQRQRGPPQRNPGRPSDDRGLGLRRGRLAPVRRGPRARSSRAAAIAGYEPTFHHETGTYVEAPWEIERVLELSDIGLCLDTGHLLLGGGDPVRGDRRTGRSRINQVHLKDARRSVMAGDHRRRRAGHRDLVARGVPGARRGRPRRRRRPRRPGRDRLPRLAGRRAGHAPADEGAVRASARRTSGRTVSTWRGAGCERAACSASD